MSSSTCRFPSVNPFSLFEPISTLRSGDEKTLSNRDRNIGRIAAVATSQHFGPQTSVAEISNGIARTNYEYSDKNAKEIEKEKEEEESDENANKITIFYCFRNELNDAKTPLRTLNTRHRFWYAVTREIESILQLGAPQRQRKVVEQAFLCGKVVGNVGAQSSLQSINSGKSLNVEWKERERQRDTPDSVTTCKRGTESVKTADLRNAETCVPFLECGSTLEDGDVVIVSRTPSSMYYRNQSALWRAWQAHCARNQIPQNQTFEDGASIARRHRVPPQYAHLVRSVQHNFDVGSQSLRFDDERLQPSERIEKDYQQQSSLQINLTDVMSEEERISLVSGVGTRIFETKTAGAPTKRTSPQKNDAEYDGARRKRANRGAVPANYVCKRCDVPGHWFADCPTHGDASFDRARIVKPTGIPQALLRKVDSVDETNASTSIMKIGNVAYEKVAFKDDLFHRLVGFDASDAQKDVKK